MDSLAKRELSTATVAAVSSAMRRLMSTKNTPAPDQPNGFSFAGRDER
jgi:hypothetical protein